MKILVTGGAGYIGSVLVPMLLEKGHEVTVLDNFYFGQSSLLPCCNDKNFTVVNGDARDEELIKKLLEKKDFIIPLAAYVGFPLCDKEKFSAYSVNTQAVKLIIDNKAENQKVIFPCTNSGYGLGQGENFCTEQSPINPISLYGKSKLEAESIVLSAENTLAFRFATLFGASPRMRTDLLLNDFVYKAVNEKSVILFEGNFKRNFLHVRDAARAFIFAMENFEKMKGKTYNCGLSSANISKIEMCQKIKEQIPDFVYIEAPVGEDPDKRNYVVSNALIESCGYKTRFTIEDGISELKKAYTFIKNNRYSNI